MNKDDLRKTFACPKCKNPLKPANKTVKCPKCNFTGKTENGIWHFLYTSGKKTQQSLTEYDLMHKKKFGVINDGSYEILAAIAVGNKTVDIACGDGIIEKLAPETVGVEFSENALKKAKKNGAKYLVLANAHALPFADNSFDVAICAGSLEHFENPQKAINEMARIAKIQVLTVHTYPPLPFAPFLFKIVTLIFGIKHQPIEKPFELKKLRTMLAKAKLHIVFEGVWTLPFNFGRVIKFLPEFGNIPSSYFVITVKK